MSIRKKDEEERGEEMGHNNYDEYKIYAIAFLRVGGVKDHHMIVTSPQERGQVVVTTTAVAAVIGVAALSTETGVERGDDELKKLTEFDMNSLIKRCVVPFCFLIITIVIVISQSLRYRGRYRMNL